MYDIYIHTHKIALLDNLFACSSVDGASVWGTRTPMLQRKADFGAAMLQRKAQQ